MNLIHSFHDSISRFQQSEIHLAIDCLPYGGEKKGVLEVILKLLECGADIDMPKITFSPNTHMVCIKIFFLNHFHLITHDRLFQNRHCIWPLAKSKQK